MDILFPLLTSDYFVIPLIIAFGILLGRVKIKGISLDQSAVIFAALFYGYLNVNVIEGDLNVPSIVQTLGLTLFIFTIGMQAGPSFFEAFRTSGKQLIIIAITLIGSAALITYLASVLLEINGAISIGLFTGALSSTPGLAAAIESTGSSDASIGYGVAYPFGVIGVILFVKLVPVIAKISVKKEEQNYADSLKSETPEISAQNFIINNKNVFGKTIGELGVREMTKANLSRVKKYNSETGDAPNQDTVLEKGDIVRAVGTEKAIKKVELLLGDKTDIDIPKSGEYDIQWVIVSEKAVVGKSLTELNIKNNYRSTIIRIRRAGVELVPRPSSVLRFGDRLLISSSKGNLEAISKLFGNSSKKINEADFLPIMLGAVVGIFLGKIELPLPVVGNFSIGLTGGVLLAALLLSRVGKFAGVIWNLSVSTNTVLRQLGLLLFLVPVGLQAGAEIGPTISKYGINLLFVGAAITSLPLIIAFLVGRFILKLNALSLLGALTGGMTSTPGLSAMDPLTETDAPQVAYATVYPFALVLLIIITQILAALLV